MLHSPFRVLFLALILHSAYFANFCANRLGRKHVIDATGFYCTDWHVWLFGSVCRLGDRDAPMSLIPHSAAAPSPS